MLFPHLLILCRHNHTFHGDDVLQGPQSVHVHNMKTFVYGLWLVGPLQRCLWVVCLHDPHMVPTFATNILWKLCSVGLSFNLSTTTFTHLCVAPQGIQVAPTQRFANDLTSHFTKKSSLYLKFSFTITCISHSLLQYLNGFQYVAIVYLLLFLTHPQSLEWHLCAQFHRDYFRIINSLTCFVPPLERSPSTNLVL